MKRFMRITVAFACGIVACLCWQFFKDCAVEPQVKNRVPTIEEIQTLIGCEKIDGKLGPAWWKSETQIKWEQALGNQYAANYMTPSGRSK